MDLRDLKVFLHLAE
ncbi:hypothetical protein YPPY45_4291, partial [Yersinia pestis PY-45]